MKHDKAPRFTCEKPIGEIDVDALIDIVYQAINETLRDTLKEGAGIHVEFNNRIQIVAKTGEVMLNARIPKWVFRALRKQLAPPARHRGTPAGRVARPTPFTREDDPESSLNEKED